MPESGERLRVRAAWMYHVEGRTQSEIADLLGIGRVAVVRLLADARRRNEVRISIDSRFAELVALERALEARHGLGRAVVAPIGRAEDDPTPAIAAALGQFLSTELRPQMKVGVGWGRTLYSSLPFMTGRTLEGLHVVSLLGGISEARRFNPAEFAWRFAEVFQGEGFLVPAPAIVDSAETKTALLERCGIAAVFDRADALDMAILSVGGMSIGATTYRVGFLTEAERLSLIAAGAVGDLLYNFLDVEGRLVDHPVNSRVISAGIDRLRRAPARVLASGGPEKGPILRAALGLLSPTALVTDERSARDLLD